MMPKMEASINRRNPRTANSRHRAAWAGSGGEQALPDELARSRPARAGEQAAAGMRDELVQHVEFRQALEDLDKAGSRVALIADEEQPGVVLFASPPRLPALGNLVDPVIIRIGAPQDFGAVVARRRCEPDMRA